MYKINLLPQDLQPQPIINKYRLMRMLSLALLGSFFVGTYIFLIIDYKIKQETLTALKQEVSISELTAKKVIQIKNERQQNEEAVNKVQQLIGSKINWYVVLGDINYCLPNDIWLTEVTLSSSKTGENETPNQELVFNGNGIDLSSIGVFIYNLQQLPYFSGVTLDYAKEPVSQTASSLLTFKISATFPEGEQIE